MKDTLKAVLSSWGTALAVIPFTVLLIYGAVMVSTSVRGAIINSVGSWMVSELIVAVVSAIVFVGLTVFITQAEGR